MKSLILYYLALWGILVVCLGVFIYKYEPFATLAPGDYTSVASVNGQVYSVDTVIKKSVDVIPYSLGNNLTLGQVQPSYSNSTIQGGGGSSGPDNGMGLYDWMVLMGPYAPTDSPSTLSPAVITSPAPLLTTTPSSGPTPTIVPTTKPFTSLPTTPVPTTPVPTTPVPTTPVPTTPVPTTPVPTTPAPVQTSAFSNVSVTNLGSGDVNTTYITMGKTYSICVLTNTGVNYTVSYNLASASLMYVLAVGGGGGGASWDSGGGGGGGVVVKPVYLPLGNGTITVNIGNGGAGGPAGGSAVIGNNTTVNFSNASGSNITAYGGGAVGAYSAGGTGGNSSVPNANGNFGYSGGAFFSTGSGVASGGGGGGAGSPALYSFSNYAYYAAGGNGYQCLLAPIAGFTPSGKSNLGSYFWGAGGGSGNFNPQGNPNNSGGMGGGGGGSGSIGGNGGTGGYNPGGGGQANIGINGGNGGANTGSGGGGTCVANGGNGGSGMVVLAFPQLGQNYLVPNYNFASPAVTANSALLNPTSIPGWTFSGNLASNTQGMTGPNGNYIIGNGTNGGYVFQCPYGQMFMCQFYTATSNNFSMTSTAFYLFAQTYSVSFVVATRGLFNAAHVMTVSLAGGSVSTASFLTSSSMQYPWIPMAFTCTPPSAGYYNLKVSWTTSNSSDSTIAISQILVT